MKNALSIDVEDWFCVHNLSGVIRKEDWTKCEPRITESLFRVLKILDEKKVKATFFVLGWIAGFYPELVKEIDQRGHEIGTHGLSHSLLTELTPEKFGKELKTSIQLIEKNTRKKVIGHRAPSFSITERTYWALDIMAKHGIKYDSSVFPVSFHPDYGVPHAPFGPYKITEEIWEFPLSVVKILGRNVPISGGGYFRIFPYRFIRYGIRKANLQGRPVVFYLHPWEMDPGQPRVKLPALKKFRHYHNLDKTEQRFRRLLNDFQFTTISEVLHLCIET
jgi:polysaccharide deacetylase family protein (PEP-CTERM system associated)